MADVLDLLISYGGLSGEWAGKWHSKGHKIWSYANPQAGPEEPETYRRNYGLLLWKNGYDGACTYAYQDSFGGNIWNDFNRPIFRAPVFAYPTADGIIDTIEWEGYREGVNDVKYLTTLLVKAGLARMGSFKKAGGKGPVTDIRKFLGGMDVQNENLYSVRAKMIDYIIGLPQRPSAR